MQPMRRDYILLFFFDQYFDAFFFALRVMIRLNFFVRSKRYLRVICNRR